MNMRRLFDEFKGYESIQDRNEFVVSCHLSDVAVLYLILPFERFVNRMYAVKH
jgi:hypothetical protein